MNIYAEALTEQLHLLASDKFNIKTISPSLPKWITGNFGMRFARFVIYPFRILGLKASIYHILDHGYGHLIFLLPARKTVVTVHDLIPLLRWKGEIKGTRQGRIPLLNLIALSGLYRARHIIADSDNTKKDLIQLLGINPKKISVIHMGISPEFKPFDFIYRKNIKKILFENDYHSIKILITGNQFYKNQETALRTIKYLVSNWVSNIKLVKTGIITEEWSDLVHLYGLENNIINIGNLPRDRMVDLFNAVDILFFPSLYEGFGWPPLEAMACGIPAIASNAGSLPEVIGDTAILLDPFDYKGYANAIIKLLTDKVYYQNYVEKGLLHVKKYSWDSTTKQILEIYEKILNDNSN
jgi:glycosyltransferase involved in cell wall biosynthesis